MKAPANCRLIGWRIVESDLWDRAHLDLSGPATLTITAQGGEIAFRALEAGLEVEYACIAPGRTVIEKARDASGHVVRYRGRHSHPPASCPTNVAVIGPAQVERNW